MSIVKNVSSLEDTPRARKGKERTVTFRREGRPKCEGQGQFPESLFRNTRTS
ncbi:hypothetical protein ZHAS_00013714 [Anopheles sinensis]|uniref:Uncharacterized protein n=1 Tax=Anopheles sinensis TaxID=74873 RepID=A0A084W6A1_ANOSI|nr:hypothetical protein ZHAS_00013714 [Anopheles sinensis]